MTEVENHSKMDDPTDQFPVGMRVLAVDDDPICLRILEALLQKCQYHVTATKHAPTALQLLRENKDKFDLVISDVHMPDMDGFKLLELVGLEMDLPVIMLSVNGDPKMVLKGITHGACDYLLKPVRVEELRNIWQHVVRKKKKTVPKEGTKTGNQDTPISHSDNGQGSAATTNSDQNGKSSKKRKDLEEDDDNEVHENGDDSDDPSAQRKPRVVWSVDLHRKFVAAVNQLGLDKAVPKRILEMMNVDQLTRENVASHLQKYRLYLKRLSCVENQQANMVAALGSADPSYQQAHMVAALGSADPSYLRTGSLSALGHLRTLNASRQFHNNAFRSFTHDGMVSRMNPPSSMNVQGLPSSGTLQVIQAQNLNNSMNGSQLKFHSALIGGNQNDQLQHNKGVSHIQNLNTNFNAKPTFPITNQRQGGLSISNNALMLEMNPQHKLMGGVSTSLAPQQHSQFSLPLMDNGRLNDGWPSVFHSSGKNSYTPSERFGPASMTPTNNMNLSGAPSPNSLTDMHSKGVTFTNTPPGQISNSVSLQGWNNHNNLSGGYNSHVIGNSIGSTIPPNGGVPDGNASMNSTFNFGDPLQMKHDGIIELPGEPSLIPHQQVHVMNQQKPRHSRFSNSVGSLEELASAMMMKQNHDMYGFRRDNNHSGGGGGGGAPL